MAAAVLAIAAIFLPAEAKDQEIDWRRGMPSDGKVDILQCQAVTFRWSAGFGEEGEELFHDVWEFFNEDAYNRCNFGLAWKRADPKNVGEYILGYDKTLKVTKRWFGSEIGSDCQNGMKMAVKTRPLMVKKYEGSECAGGLLDIGKNKATVKACRKQCKKRRNCCGIEFNPADTDKNCRLYKCINDNAPGRKVPELLAGTPNPVAQCEVAAATCEGQPNIPAPAPTPPAVCDMALTVKCEVCVQGEDEGCRGTDCNFWGDSGQCDRQIRYKYTFSNKSDGAIWVHSLKRFRPGDTFGFDQERQLGGSNYRLPKGSTQFIGETGPFDFCKDGSTTTTFVAEISCDTQGKTAKQYFDATYTLDY